MTLFVLENQTFTNSFNSSLVNGCLPWHRWTNWRRCSKLARYCSAEPRQFLSSQMAWEEGGGGGGLGYIDVCRWKGRIFKHLKIITNKFTV